MSYKIEACVGTPSEIEELARFLADFIADGEGPQGDGRERTVELWQARILAWWENNPFCGPESPRGLMIRTAAGDMVGFFGMIPHDYVHQGRIIPGVIATTSYVREAHRSAALGLFMKAHRLPVDYHFVDGTPNRLLEPVLDRFGYHREPTARMFLYPVNRGLGRLVRWCCRKPGALPEGGQRINDPAEAKQCADFPDDRLRRAITLDSLAWYLESGTSPHQFIGWCDEDGTLRAYCVGMMKTKSKLKAFVIFDYAAADSAADAILENLIGGLAVRPVGMICGADLVVWPKCADEPAATDTKLQRSFDPRLFYRMPKSEAETPRSSRPFEGDGLFQ